jgi:hypothetical protein
VKVLVFGSSDTTGEAFGRPEQSWPRLVCDRIAEETGAEIDLVQRETFAWLPSAGNWAESMLDRYRPDLVFIWLGTHAYAMSLVSEAVRRRWGERPAEWVTRIESSMRPGPVAGGLRGKVYLGAKLGARRVLGADRYCSPEQAAEGYAAVIRAAAQSECDIVTVLAARNYYEDGMTGLYYRFAAAVRPAVDQHRALWVSSERALRGQDRRNLFMVNGMHKTPEAHRWIAEHVVAEMRTAGVALQP